jgi:hypothetical protein
MRSHGNRIAIFIERNAIVSLRRSHAEYVARRVTRTSGKLVM